MSLSFIDFFVLFVVIIILFFYLKNYYAEVQYVKSTVDGRTYLVRRLPNSQQAADYIANANKDIEKLAKHLLAKYPDNDDVKRLYKNFNPANVSESSPFSGYTSYSVDKGSVIMLCIRQNDVNQTFVEKNTTMFVFLHECAHLACKEIGHTSHFWDLFRFILKEAIEIGIYTHIDYSKKPEPYCSIKISSNPLST